jgi:hypothetical protein
MSEFQDHPDIENLPLEIDGNQVREVVRAVFRESVNGTPDNISRAGCITLAKKGKDVWNAWRSAFPSRWEFRRQTAPSGFKSETTVWVNVADFSLFDGSQTDFCGYRFGDGANFEGACWNGDVEFTGSRWGNAANFKGVDFGTWPVLEGCVWGDHADFMGACFGSNARLAGSAWGVAADFSFTLWGDANLSGAMFGKQANFRGAEWRGLAYFGAVGWDEVQHRFSNDELLKLKESGLAPDRFHKIDFSGARFLAGVDFGNRKFLGTCYFLRLAEPFQTVQRDQETGRAQYDPRNQLTWQERRNRPPEVSFGKPPKFHGCDLHQDTSFDGAVFPQASGGEEAARAYRTLKLAFSKQQAVREEQRFFRLEMEEETLRETGLKRWLFVAYKKFSDYGFSVVRPLAYSGVAIGALTLFYGLLSWWGQCGIAAIDCSFAPQWLEFSLLQTLPLPGLDKLSEAASKAFWPTGSWWGLLLSSLVIVHKTISLAALFLVGLALRNLFKLK